MHRRCPQRVAEDSHGPLQTVPEGGHGEREMSRGPVAVCVESAFVAALTCPRLWTIRQDSFLGRRSGLPLLLSKLLRGEILK